MNLAEKSPEEIEKMNLQAAENPGGWIYEFDFHYKNSDEIPPEAIVGAWKVSDNGDLLDEFVENSNYRPIISMKRKPRDYIRRGVNAGNIDDFANSWTIEVDPDFDHLFPKFPDHAIIGRWYIDSRGNITDLFRPNPKYQKDYSDKDLEMR